MTNQQLFAWAFLVIALSGLGMWAYYMAGLLKDKQAASDYFLQKTLALPPPPPHPSKGREASEAWQKRWDAYKAQFPY
ncbi:hypothetical protein [Hymenobacter sp. BT491]|uniref:hypothetical protein n=1 Tax=Hymenobacter sp. BT491 TaxID=2766779 RepID=UPI001653839F|nr:hypothetical protein [Hymenobacter sp. BT491]MBC6988947.1 hypothetical protein [Hymenobacter sp. BT491]